MLAEFAHIMKENQNSMTVTDKAEWWTRRKSLDIQLKVSNLEAGIYFESKIRVFWKQNFDFCPQFIELCQHCPVK